MGETNAAVAVPQTPGDISIIEDDDATYLRTEDGLSLYRCDLDVDGKSHCVTACSVQWPPVIASSDAHPVGDWTLVKRADGSRQWAYRGKPVYTYSRDVPGRSDGDGIGGVWHVVRP